MNQKLTCREILESPSRADGDLEIARGACPHCGSQVEMQEGCLKCRSCGFTEC